MKGILIGVYIWKGKAYIPTRARFDSGIWVDIEPVYTADLNESELVSAIKSVIVEKYPVLQDPTAEEWRSRKDPVLQMTRARSWKNIARTGASYSISKNNERIRLDMSKLDEKGRWEVDPRKTSVLPPDTPIEHIVGLILDDVQSRNLHL